MVGVYRIGDEILVNTATTGAQHSQKIAALSDGSFVVTWVDYSQSDGGATGDSSEGAIKAQLFGPGGTPVGGELLVNTTTTNDQYAVQVTALTGGGFAVTWNDYSGTDGSGAAVRAQVFNGDGVEVSEELLVNTATNGTQAEPEITALANGGFVITWVDESLGVEGASGDAHGYAVKAQVFTGNGERVGGELLVNTATEGNQGAHQVTSLANGGFVITWTDPSNGVGGAGGDSSGSAVKAQVFDGNGGRVGGELLVNQATAGDQGDPQVAALANGGFVITWTDGSMSTGGATGDGDGWAVKARVFHDNGTPASGELLVNTATANDQMYPRVTALVGGGFVIAWTDHSHGVGGAEGDEDGTAVKAQVFNAGGVAVGGEILVNTTTAGDQFNHKIAALSDGGFVITWADMGAADADGGAVKAQAFAADGSPVGAELLVNTATAGNQDDPEVTALANGAFAITWRDNSTGVGGAEGDKDGFAVKAQVFGTDNTPDPAPSTPDLDAASDTGASNSDNITGDNTPTFTGTGVNGSTVTLLANGQPVGSAVVTGGVYTITSSVLADGLYEITAFSTDPAGNVSPASAALVITIDTTVAGGGGGGGGNLPDVDPIIGGGTTGNDRIRGTDGNDSIFGRDGDDDIYAGDGDDEVYAGDGNDIVLGEDGDDTLGGGAGNDQVWGGDGNDVVYGGPGNDTLGGGTGNDEIWGGLGADVVYGGAGNDTLGGGEGSDTIFAGTGNDVVYGGAGDDVLFGGTGADSLFGGDGADTLWGGEGNDQLMGGGGADTFAFILGNGNDVVTDFDPLGGDVLALNGQSFTTGTNGNGDLVLILSGGGSITLKGVIPAALSLDWFV